MEILFLYSKTSLSNIVLKKRKKPTCIGLKKEYN